MIKIVFFCLVLYCYDGDTCKCKTGESIRLVGIDTPERNSHKCNPQPYAEEAREVINGLVKGKKTTVISEGRDIYGRILGTIKLGKLDVCEYMVKEGLAEVYRGIDYENHPYFKEEIEARKNGLGMWSLEDDYESPRAYRKRCFNR